MTQDVIGPELAEAQGKEAFPSSVQISSPSEGLALSPLPEEATTSPLDLLPLTPEFSEDQHGVYVKEIQSALECGRIRNIALSGSYGVGKSSILAEVARLYPEEVVEISLSTLAPIVPGVGVPEQAATTTNRIQQEIVKQLLYRELPRNTPGSRFRRIERFDHKREAAGAGLTGAAVCLGFLLSGWTTKIASAFGVIWWGRWIHLVVLVLAAAATYLVRSLSYGRLSIKQLSAGPATVTLDGQSATYFDQYLDEIVYFFEVSRRSIVIFEDIDRFDDPHIFETLRALNTLLNAAATGKPIRFIYAMKDSIFERLGTSEDASSAVNGGSVEVIGAAHRETRRANRTKFFDLVIPVVPFITQHNAKSVAARLLVGVKADISPELIDIASRHVPDMRLLKNVRNEFLIFRDRILSGDGKTLAITETELFAMMLYKSTHLSDFEAIRLGGSRLDVLYATSREIITDSLRSVNKKILAASKKKASVDGIPERSARLGVALMEEIHRAIRVGGYASDTVVVNLAGEPMSEPELATPEFWRKFLARGSEARLDVEVRHRHRVSKSLYFSKSDLERTIGAFNVDEWAEDALAELEAKLEGLREEASFLRGADIAELMKRPSLSVDPTGAARPIANIVRQVLASDLTFDLVRAGYINRNFALYTAVFQGDRVGTAATNFIVHNLQRGRMDMHFELSAGDVEAVLREGGKTMLGDPALYNVKLLDHLLSTQKHEVSVARFVDSFRTMGPNQHSFLGIYLIEGRESRAFMRALTSVQANVLSILVKKEELADDARSKLFGVALESVKKDIEYKVDGGVSRYISERYESIPSLKSEEMTKDQASLVGRIFAKAGVRVHNLPALSRPMREALVGRNQYAINYENLMAATAGGDLSLDVLLSSSPRVYAYVITDLAAYLTALPANVATVQTSTAFVRVLNDLQAKEEADVRKTIARASFDCSVANLEEVAVKLWPLLAELLRFPASTANVLSYLNEYGDVDHGLSLVLVNADGVESDEAASRDDRVAIARAVLRARDLIPTIVRVSTVVGLDVCMSAEDIEVESGDLLPLLMEACVIEDSPETYTLLAGTSWETRQSYIFRSRKFSEYLSPELVADDLEPLLASPAVPDAVKRAVLVEAGRFALHATRAGLLALSRYAFQVGGVLPYDAVLKIATAGVTSEQAVSHLVPLLSALSDEEVLRVMVALGKPYEALSKPGGDTFKVASTPQHRELLRDLKRRGIVSSFPEKGDRLRVYKKRK